MEASSVLHQVMNSHSLDEVLGCGKQPAQSPQPQQMMHAHHSPGEHHQQHIMHAHHSQADPHHQQQQHMMQHSNHSPGDVHPHHQQQQHQQQDQQQQQSAAADPSKRLKPQPEQALRCPRCDSTNTKFCYYNNYSLSQPRYFCKGCRRYWTQGGTLRNVPVGGGCRKKRPSSTSSGIVATKLNKIHVVASAAQDHHCSPVPTPDPAASPLHLPHSSSAPASSTLGYDPSDLSLAFARLQQKTQQQQHVDAHHDHAAAAFLHLLPGAGGAAGPAAVSAPTSSAAGNGFLDFLRGGSAFLDVGTTGGGGAFCNPYAASGFSGSGLLLGSAGDSDGPLLPIADVGAPNPHPVVVKQETCSRGVLDGGDTNSKGGGSSSTMMAMMGFHHHQHQWAPHQQVQLQHPFMLGATAATATAGGADVGFASGLGGTAVDYWSTFGPAASWHGLVNSSLI